MKWLYHKEHGAKLFKADENPEGWVDSPAKFDLAVEAKQEEKEEIKEKPKKKKAE